MEKKVKVYTVGQGDDIASREICGGPHVEHTGILGHFKIQKEESSSSGVRRIKSNTRINLTARPALAGLALKQLHGKKKYTTFFRQKQRLKEKLL